MVYAFLGSPDQDIFLNILRAERVRGSLSIGHTDPGSTHLVPRRKQCFNLGREGTLAEL